MRRQGRRRHERVPDPHGRPPGRPPPRAVHPHGPDASHLVRDLRQTGKTMLLTTHYMEEAEQLCDRVAIMDHGRIIELGTPAALIHKYFHETAIEFTAQSDVPRESLTALPAVSQTRFENGHVTLYSTDVPQTMAALFELASASALAFHDMSVRQATLEDVFLELTGNRLVIDDEE